MSLLIWQVFSKGTMDAFILRSIYPKLSQCLSEFIINPHQQHLGMLHFHLQPQIVNSPHWQPYISWHIKCENMAFHQANPSISSFDLLYNFLFPMLFMNCFFNIFIEPFHWVMEWEDIITQQHFISLLEKHFFPRWIQVCREDMSFNSPRLWAGSHWSVQWPSKNGVEFPLFLFWHCLFAFVNRFSVVGSVSAQITMKWFSGK